MDKICLHCKTNKVSNNFNYFCKKCYFILMKCLKIRNIELREYLSCSINIYFPYVENWLFQDYHIYAKSYIDNIKPLSNILEILVFLKYNGKKFTITNFINFPIKNR